ncbi:MAG: HPr family phosphocarrier protein [Oscillospiraceae bacterium]
MKEFEWTIQAEYGIHARPAGSFVNCASRFASDITVWLADGSKRADGKRQFSMMGLSATQGTAIRVRAEGVDEEEAIHELKAFCREFF